MSTFVLVAVVGGFILIVFIGALLGKTNKNPRNTGDGGDGAGSWGGHHGGDDGGGGDGGGGGD